MLKQGLKARHVIFSSSYKKEIERLVATLPRKHQVNVKWCKPLVELCEFPQDGRVFRQRKTFLHVESEPSVVLTTVSTTDARSATKRFNPRTRCRAGRFQVREAASPPNLRIVPRPCQIGDRDVVVAHGSVGLGFQE